MKLLLTGASGLVGSAFVRVAAQAGHELVGIVGRYAGRIEGLAAQRTIDFADASAATRAVLELGPDAIVNCAAVSVPEACESDPVLSRALNVDLPASLAEAAQRSGCRLVHLSSEQVFDGRTRTPYAVDAPVSPLNLYGRQKVESERAVQAAAPAWAVTLRAPLLMGNSLTRQRSVHERLLLDWAAGRTAKLFVDEFRQPCTATNLAAAMLELCARDEIAGVFHWAGAELISRHELGVRIRAHFKLNDTRAPIVAVKHADVPAAAAKRQPCLALELEPLTSLLRTRPQNVEEQLRELTMPAE